MEQDKIAVEFRKGVVELRDQAHFFFDKIWQVHGLNRREAYKAMAAGINTSRGSAHMSRMKTETKLKAVIVWSVNTLNEFRRIEMVFEEPPTLPYYEIFVASS